MLISWQVVGGGLELQWEERGGPLVTPPRRSGFGSTLIRSSATGGDDAVAADWLPTGVIWSFRLSSGVTFTGGAAPAAQPVVAAPESDGLEFTGCRILIVEDEPLIAFDLSSELEDAGAEIVAIAPSVAEALQVAADAEIDVAILDGNLGGEPVDPVAAALAHRQIPFCFVSGYGRAHLPADFAEAPVIEKPFRSDALFAALRNLRATRRAAVAEPV